MPELDPIIFKVPEPTRVPFIRRIYQKINADSTKSTKIITAVATFVIVLSTISFFVFTAITNNKKYKNEHHISQTGQIEVPSQSSSTELSDASLPSNGIAVGTSVNTGTNSPIVTLTATAKSLNIGSKTHLKWSVTNNPKECTASEDWSGAKQATGEEDTAVLDIAQTYIFILTCKTDTGTGVSTLKIDVTAKESTGSVATRPHIQSLTAVGSGYTGYPATLTWVVSNNPTTCVASDDWSGNKGIATSNSETTSPLNSARDYTFTLTCSNAAGNEKISAHYSVADPPPDVPITELYSDISSPTTLGSNPRLTWSATNNPTSCTASGDWTGSKSKTGGNQLVGALNTLGKTYTFILTCSNASGSTLGRVDILTVPSPPQVSLTPSSSWAYVGGTATVSWTTTNSPTSCTASGDWSGSKTPSGGSTTVSLTTAKTYLFSLSCINAGGTASINDVPLGVSIPPVPAVDLAVNPISITTGQSATLSWTPTNNPTSCTGSGNGWTAGSKPINGPLSTGVKNTAGTYTFTLVCSNAGGNSSASTVTLSVNSGGGAVSPPVASLAISPKTIGTGSSSTITWSATNSPTSCTASNTAGSSSWTGSKSASGTSSTGVLNTAGTYTFSVTCTNSAGTSPAGSDTITVVAVPAASISVSPNPITAGGTTTVTWSATNSPTSCTAGGTGWSGSKSGSGSQSLSFPTAGTYTLTVQCSNAGGTGSTASTSITVNAAATQYCKVAGVPKTPCYGTATMATHVTIGNCWGWISNATKGNWVIDITNYAPKHKGGTNSGSLAVVNETCNRDILPILNGTVGITGFRDGSGSTKHTHSSAQGNSNTGNYQSGSNNYMMGYYDPTNPN